MKQEFDGIPRSKYDGRLVRSKLSGDLIEEYKTENQWLEEKRRVRDGAVPVEMHPTMMNKKLYEYYTFDQTEEEHRRICATCGIRINRYCPVAGQYVSMKNKCSEWSD